jgi:thioredoxin reductase (NADPH)
VPTPSIIDTRRDQMFPTLAPAEIGRLHRFGALRSYSGGEPLVRVGEVGQGLTIILTGEVRVTRRDQSGRRERIVI